MTYDVIFTPEALDEMQESYDWYEEKEYGLGERFVLAVEQSIEVIAINPVAFSKRKGTLHEKVVKVFPFLIVYKIIERQGVINVLHVFHTSRHPKEKYKR